MYVYIYILYVNNLLLICQNTREGRSYQEKITNIFFWQR